MANSQMDKIPTKSLYIFKVTFLAFVLSFAVPEAIAAFQLGQEEVSSITIDGLSTANEPPISLIGEGSIYYNSDAGEFRISEDGAAYTPLVGGSADFRNGGEAGTAARSLGNTDNFDLNILTNGASRITIKDSGRVGIGVTNPDQPLEVNGAIKSVESLVPTLPAIVVDWRLGNQQTVVLSQTGHTVDFNNFFAGQIFRLIVCQDGTGGRTISSWLDDVRFPDGATNTALSTAANTCDVISFIVTDAAGIPASTPVIFATIVRGFDAS